MLPALKRRRLQSQMIMSEVDHGIRHSSVSCFVGHRATQDLLRPLPL